MKKNAQKILPMVLLYLSISLHSLAFEVGGINYQAYSYSDEATVTYWDCDYANYIYNVNKKYTGHVVIPENIVYEGKKYTVTSIGDNAFRNCSGLTSITIPSSVTSRSSCISITAFIGCSNLTTVSVDPQFLDILLNISNPKMANIFGSQVETYILTGNVTSIPEQAFSGCSSLTSITIPSSVTSIPKGAFSGCTSLTSLILPNSINSIGASAFQGCSSLASIILPNSLKSIGESAFQGCSSLASIIIPNTVTDIGLASFQNCSSLTSVTIPNSVTSIGDFAFNNCTSLTSITIPYSVMSIGDYAFYNHDHLTTVTLNSPVIAETVQMKNIFGNNVKTYVLGDSVKTIGNDAFRNCSLTSITIPNSVTSIGSNAFAECKGLPSITIPNSVTSIGEGAFYGCEKLDSITIPSSITSINNETFAYCIEMKSVAIPNTVTSIGDHAFQRCYKLSSLTIPNSVTSIGDAVFESCSALSNIYLQWEDPSVCSLKDDYAKGFKISKKTKIHIPYGTLNNYKAWAYAWSDAFVYDEYLLTYLVDGEVYMEDTVSCNTTLILISEPTREGYTFSGWSEIPETMPAHDVTVTGTFTINSYLVTYMLDNEVYATDSVEYGAKITPPSFEDIEGYTFDGWSDVPETMPAHDIIIHGTLTSGIESISLNKDDTTIYSVGGRKLNRLQRGINIIRRKDGIVRKVIMK